MADEKEQPREEHEEQASPLPSEPSLERMDQPTEPAKGWLSRLTPQQRLFLIVGGALVAMLFGLNIVSHFHRKHAQQTSPVDISHVQQDDQGADANGLFQVSPAQQRSQSGQRQDRSGQAFSVDSHTQGSPAEADAKARLDTLKQRLALIQLRGQIQVAEAKLRVPAYTQDQRSMTVPVNSGKKNVEASASGANRQAAPHAQEPGESAGANHLGSQSELISKVTTEPSPQEAGRQAFLKMGTFIDATLENELVTDNASSPVMALVNRSYYDPLTRKLLVPAGTRVLGVAHRVKYQTSSRLAITFKVFQFPDGHTISLSPEEQALEANGIFGLMDRVNRHTARILFTAGLVGVLTGWNASQIQGNYAYGGNDMMRIQAGQSVSHTAQQLLSPFLNAVPTITVHAGHPMKIWIMRDIPLDHYHAQE
ncbi:MAG: TrbI/VirB10 family protein [Acidobacteriota bacterium]